MNIEEEMTGADYLFIVLDLFRKDGWKIEEELTGRYAHLSQHGTCEERIGIAHLIEDGETTYHFTWPASGPEDADADALLDTLAEHIDDIKSSNYEILVGGNCPANKDLLKRFQRLLALARIEQEAFYESLP